MRSSATEKVVRRGRCGLRRRRRRLLVRRLLRHYFLQRRWVSSVHGGGDSVREEDKTMLCLLSHDGVDGERDSDRQYTWTDGDGNEATRKQGSTAIAIQWFATASFVTLVMSFDGLNSEKAGLEITFFYGRNR